MPLSKKLLLIFKNQWITIKNFQSCCNNPGEPAGGGPLASCGQTEEKNLGEAAGGGPLARGGPDPEGGPLAKRVTSGLANGTYLLYPPNFDDKLVLSDSSGGGRLARGG